MKPFVLICLMFLSQFTWATHLRSGYISVDRLSRNSLTCRITLTVYTSTSSPVQLGGGLLNFGDGSLPVETPYTPSTIRPGLGPSVGVVTYTVEHTYSAPGSYSISYMEQSRNAGIINLQNSVSTPFYIQTNYNLDPFLDVFSTPAFPVDPFFTAQAGSPVSLSIHAVSPDDFILRYELSTPKSLSGQPVSGYTLPENVTVNPFNGLFTWDGKFRGQYIPGEYLFTVNVHLFKEINGSTYRLSTVTYDVQLILADESAQGRMWMNTSLETNNRLYLPPGQTQAIKFYYEPNSTNTAIAAFSELEHFTGAFSFMTYDSAEAPIKVGVLTLTSTAEINRDNPYIITIRGQHVSGAMPFPTDQAILFYTRDLQPGVITGIEEDVLSVAVFPNPVNDFLHIQNPAQRLIQVSIVDTSGKIIRSVSLDHDNTLDLRYLNQGLYLCIIQSGTGRKVFKIIKE
jgi:hypothetical protein